MDLDAFIAKMVGEVFDGKHDGWTAIGFSEGGRPLGLIR